MTLKTQIKFSIIASGIGLVIVLCFLYWRIDEYFIAQEISKARLLADTVIDFRNYLAKIAPDINFENNRYPFACTPAYTVNQVANIIRSQKHFILRQVSDRPRNPKDKPNPYELKAINYFKTHKSAKEFYQIHHGHHGTSIMEHEHIFYAKPLIVQKSCLKCHGVPGKDVPPKLYNLLVKYYGNSAFDYKLGDLRGILSIVIPFYTIKNDVNNVFKILALIVLIGYSIGTLVFLKITSSVENSIHEIIEYFKKNIQNNNYVKLEKNFKLNEFEELKNEINNAVDKISLYQKELFEQLYYNSLTHLPNRNSFLKSVNKDKIIAVFDIDNFKNINTFFGFEFADNVILEVSKRFKQLSKVYNFEIYHIDIDKFVLTFDSNMEKEELIKTLGKIIKELEKEYLIENNEIMLKFRVGVSYYNKDYLRAEMAQEYAKELGKDIVLGSEVIKDNKVFQENITWYKKLKKALEEDRIVPFYQPIVDRDKKVVKYEALVRMIDEDEKVISPFFFLDIAKMTRNYFEITKRMIKKSFEKFNNKDIGVSINLDLHDLESNEIRNYIMEHLNKCNVKATFEVVESEDIRNSKEITQYLKTFQKNGAEIYIDDFGSGYANFDYLLKLSPNGVKIDGSLVKDITENKKNETMIRAIVSFSHDIGLKVVAEFVEDEKIFKKLKELGVDYFQGYYFGKPQKDIKV